MRLRHVAFALVMMSALGCAHFETWPSANILPRGVLQDPRFPDAEVSVHNRVHCYHYSLLFSVLFPEPSPRRANLYLTPRKKTIYYAGRVVSCERGLLAWWRCSKPKEVGFIFTPRNSEEIRVGDGLERAEAIAVVERTLDALDEGIWDEIDETVITREDVGPIRFIERRVVQSWDPPNCAYEVSGLCVPDGEHVDLRGIQAVRVPAVCPVTCFPVR